MNVEQAATRNTHGFRWRWYFKRMKAKEERRRAKKDIDCAPGYGRFCSTVD